MDKEECKILKDPVYGYIKIPTLYMTEIVDTAEFQRLRRILQTSYAPLYSSAIHNRFVHSIGVFYLGQIVASRLIQVNKEKRMIAHNDMVKYAKIYKLACLLHDVGHAPFSHTGEIFYSPSLNTQLAKLIKSKAFTKYVETIGVTKGAAPHEIMSAIIGLKNYGKYFKDSDDKELFARCITGYLYPPQTPEEQIKNCFINMLNSKVIDVDRLDYLIRDAYISGFKSMNIDYERLLSALTIVKYPFYSIAYEKNALSIIENVVYAHDAERKWIQNHPVVSYEAYIIKHIIMNLNDGLKETVDSEKNSLFSEAALSRTGVQFSNGIKVSLLCDDDIVFLFKNIFQDPTSLNDEFFDRRARRHPIWKSEAEYSAYIDSLCRDGKLKHEFEEAMTALADGEQKGMPSFITINEQYIDKLRTELKTAGEEEYKFLNNPKLSQTEKQALQHSFAANRRGINRKLLICECLSHAAKERNLECDYVITSARFFSSNFSKEDMGKTLIVFRDGENENIYRFDQVCNILRAGDVEKESGKNFFYIFYRRKCTKEESRADTFEFVNKADFCRDLFTEATRRVQEY